MGFYKLFSGFEQYKPMRVCKLDMKIRFSIYLYHPQKK